VEVLEVEIPTVTVLNMVAAVAHQDLLGEVMDMEMVVVRYLVQAQGEAAAHKPTRTQEMVVRGVAMP